MLRAFEITDASRELAAVGNLIRHSDDVAGKNVLLGFSKCLGVDPSSPVFFELLSVLRGRIYNLDQFARTVQDVELDNGLRSEVATATAAFAQLFDVNYLISPWQQARASCVPDANLKTLMWFGQTARRHRPLRVVTDEERFQLLEKIDEALQGFDDDPLFRWMNAPLTDGLVRLKTVLEHFKFFGHEMAIEELLVFSRKIEAFKDTQGDTEDFLLKLELPSLRKAFELVALVGTLFIMPDQAVTAYDRYVSWQQRMIVSSTHQPEQRLLPPPLATLPSPSALPKPDASK